MDFEGKLRRKKIGELKEKKYINNKSYAQEKRPKNMSNLVLNNDFFSSFKEEKSQFKLYIFLES